MSDICESNGNARIDGNSATIFVATSPSGAYAGNSSWNIRPYGRKGDEIAMGKVRRFMIKTTSVYEDLPHCRQTHDVPAILFSGGGYSGNHFHSFTDVLIPLFLTSREFNGEVQFLVSDFRPSWTSKYGKVLEKLSRYETIDIDKQEGVHCFPNMIVGLKHHKEFNIDPAKSRYSMKDFRQFLRGAYSLKRETTMKMRNGEAEKPRLLMITRRRTRAFMNEAEIANMARSLGYNVILAEPDADLSRFAHLVNSCDVMMGVHGAGLTNMVFLPENAVLIQVVPFGRMEWIARTDFGEPSKDMNLRYLEYKINAEESSLIQQYPLDHEIFREPYTIQKNGWAAFSSVYLEKQNVKLDVERYHNQAKPICTVFTPSEPRSDVCEMTGDIRIRGNSFTIFAALNRSKNLAQDNSSWSIRPYAQKGDENAMKWVRKFIIKTSVVRTDMPNCTQTHSVPAIVFSSGGYALNQYHDFSDLVIPLFLTSRQFNGEVRFLIANKRSLWTNKFREVLQNLSRYDIIDIDKEDGVHCFPSMIVGLKQHKQLGIDPSMSAYSMKDFRNFITYVYSLNRVTPTNQKDGEKDKKPCLLIISRRKSRSIINEAEIGDMARGLGYEIVVTEGEPNVPRLAKLVNSCDLMMGVHGAGLTNMVFLPENAVVIQVVPWGIRERIARTFYGEPEKDMNISYLEYKIREGESSLIHEYPLDHEVFRDPLSVMKKGWGAFRSVYLEKQHIKLDVGRFRGTLLEALHLLRM
ncbi:hypothetical protein RJ639_000760 [Escallonia herrerae]|uniref:Glycosyltransferase 61 catalytic domain-containing protein n=1 Tax=Escallonia herrerae TaxID=1293975 RepID=A0AA88XA21_9ASTE|nr:hypothetical protein RJ639_000760 [Escallonia herrerae]